MSKRGSFLDLVHAEVVTEEGSLEVCFKGQNLHNCLVGLCITVGYSLSHSTLSWDGHETRKDL